MGGIIGGAISAAGSVYAANKQASAQRYAADEARQTALTGYNYLTSGAGSSYANQLMGNGQQANSQIAALLGVGTGSAADKANAQNGFQNYLGSTGYNFQLGQGTNAVASNAASTGALNSGGTLKALQNYGQGMASNYFNTYLGQLGGVASAGQNTLGQIGNAGSAGAFAAGPVASSLNNAAASQASGIQAGFNALGNAAGAAYNNWNNPTTSK